MPVPAVNLRQVAAQFRAVVETLPPPPPRIAVAKFVAYAAARDAALAQEAVTP